MIKRSTGIRFAVIVAMLLGVAMFLRIAGGGFMTTLRRMHGHP